MRIGLLHVLFDNCSAILEGIFLFCFNFSEIAIASFIYLFFPFLKLASKDAYEKSRDELKKKKAAGPGKVSTLVIIFTSLEVKMNPHVMEHIQRSESLGIILAEFPTALYLLF